MAREDALFFFINFERKPKTLTKNLADLSILKKQEGFSLCKSKIHSEKDRYQIVSVLKYQTTNVFVSHFSCHIVLNHHKPTCVATHSFSLSLSLFLFYQALSLFYFIFLHASNTDLHTYKHSCY